MNNRNHVTPHLYLLADACSSSGLTPVVIKTWFLWPKNKISFENVRLFLEWFERFSQGFAPPKSVKFSLKISRNVLFWFYLQTTRKSCWQPEMSGWIRAAMLQNTLFNLSCVLTRKSTTIVKIMGRFFSKLYGILRISELYIYSKGYVNSGLKESVDSAFPFH